MRQIEDYKFDNDLQFSDAAAKYQWHLQRVIKEKKDLEKQMEEIRSQLVAVGINTDRKKLSTSFFRKSAHMKALANS